MATADGHGPEGGRHPAESNTKSILYLIRRVAATLRAMAIGHGHGSWSLVAGPWSLVINHPSSISDHPSPIIHHPSFKMLSRRSQEASKTLSR